MSSATFASAELDAFRAEAHPTHNAGEPGAVSPRKTQMWPSTLKPSLFVEPYISLARSCNLPLLDTKRAHCSVTMKQNRLVFSIGELTKVGGIYSNTRVRKGRGVKQRLDVVLSSTCRPKKAQEQLTGGDVKAGDHILRDTVQVLHQSAERITVSGDLSCMRILCAEV